VRLVAPFLSPPLVSSPPPVSAALHFSTSDSLMTMVSATSFTDRPVCRYLFTCLQFTSAATPSVAVPSTKVPPSTRIPNRMRASLRVSNARSPCPLVASGGAYTNAAPARKVTAAGGPPPPRCPCPHDRRGLEILPDPGSRPRARSPPPRECRPLPPTEAA